MNVIAAADLLPADPLRYLVWVDAGRWYRSGVTVGGHNGGGTPKGLPELTPRQALHLVECRNGAAA